MIAIGVRESRLVSQSAAYVVNEHLKAGHAAMMHGILVLPALAWLASFTRWPEARRLQVVALACLGYALPATAVLTDAARGIGPLDAVRSSALTVLLDGAGTASLLVAAIAVVVALARHGAGQGLRYGLEQELAGFGVEQTNCSPTIRRPAGR